MAQLIYNPNLTIKGPWLISYKNLRDLDTIIQSEWYKWNLKIDEDINLELEKEISEYPKMNREAGYKRLNESYSYKRNKELVIKLKNNNKVIANNFEEAAKEISIVNEVPIGFTWKIIVGDFSFELSLSKYSQDNFVMEIAPENHLFTKEIFFKINEWLSDIKPSFFLRLWKNIFGFHWFIFGTISFIFLSIISSFNGYNYVLNQKAADLLQNGLDQTEIDKAIEIILSKQTNFSPPDYKVSFTNSITTILIVLSIVLIVSLLLTFLPKSYLGIGKGEKIVKRWKSWIKLIFISIPTTILLPVIIDRIIKLF